MYTANVNILLCGFRYCDVYTVKSLNLECHVISKQDVDSNRFPK